MKTNKTEPDEVTLNYNTWQFSVGVSTFGFHPRDMGSIPIIATMIINKRV